MNNALYERAKKFANTNVIGNCGELECLAEMLYEFAEQETKDLEAQIEKISKVTHICDNINCNHNDTKGLCCLFNPENCKYRQLQKENAELKVEVGLSIDCEKAQKNGELCLGYGGDEDEPCERCKNCIKCETGYFQLRETEKDEQLTKAKEIMNIAIEGIKHWGIVGGTERPFEKQAEKLFNLFLDKAEQFLKEE